MKALLTSAGFTNEEIFQTCEKLVGKKRANIKIATIEEAHKVEAGDLSWFTEEKQILLDNFKSVTPLPLASQPLPEIEKLIADADMIYCFGGNTTYLTKVLEDTGFAKILPDLLEKKVWVGSSAGSCVLGYKESDQMSQDFFKEKPYTDHYLNLLPIIIFPHYLGDFKYDRADIEREAKSVEYPICVLSDQSAVKVIGKPKNKKYNFELIGDDFLVNVGGKFVGQPGQIDDVMNSASETLDSASKVLDSAKSILDNIFKK